MGEFKNKLTPPQYLRQAELPHVPATHLRWLEHEPKSPSGQRPDGRLELRCHDHVFTFICEYKPDWSTKSLTLATEQARRYAAAFPADRPLVILPYLKEDALQHLLSQNVSGLDLCGNAVITTPDCLIFVTGRPNRFRTHQPLRSPYRGVPALVGRMLLEHPRFPTAEALRHAITQRGGRISQPLVSRVINALREDLVISDTTGREVRLIQPERLLKELARAWQPKAVTLWRGRVQGSPASFLPRLFNAAQRADIPLVTTGVTSASRYTSLTTEPVAYVYADRLADLPAAVEGRETDRFVNLVIMQPPDESVYFAAERDADGVRWASTVQTYLEMQAGDARLREAASALHDAILKRVREEAPA